MRSGVLNVFLLSLLVLICSFQAGFCALSPENLLVIDRGPVFFSHQKTKHSFEFEVTAQNLENCHYISTFIGLKSGIEGSRFSIKSSFNGRDFGGSSTPMKRWHISGSGLGITQFKIGKNRIDIEAILDNWDKTVDVTYEGCVGGIVLYFSKIPNEDIGLLDYINYGEPEAPEPKEEGEEKSKCWVTGIIHLHTTFSDGMFTVAERAKQVQDLGGDFMIVTDHYEQIDKSIKAPGLYYKWLRKPSELEIGFRDYLESCRSETKDNRFVAIAGAEVSTPWHLTDKTVCYAHTLCLGNVQKTVKLNSAQGKEGKQAEVITAVNGLGLSVAAHPNLTSLESISFKPWEGIHFRYDQRDKEKYAGLNGVEIGNTVSSDQDDDDMAFFMKLMKAHHPAFPTGGCDSHGWGDKEDGKRMRRATGVYIEKLTENGLLKAMEEGHVWASIENIRITDCDPVPGFTMQFVESADFSFTLTGLPTKVRCQMYRDGQPIPESIQVVSSELPTYNWTDTNCPNEETWYNFRVLPNYLITAPIILFVGD